MGRGTVINCPAWENSTLMALNTQLRVQHTNHYSNKPSTPKFPFYRSKLHVWITHTTVIFLFMSCIVSQSNVLQTTRALKNTLANNSIFLFISVSPYKWYPFLYFPWFPVCRVYCTFCFVLCKTSQSVNILQLLTWSKFKV